MSKKERYDNNIKIWIKIKGLKCIGDGKINLVADAKQQKHKIKKCLTVVLISDKISLVANETKSKKLWKKLLT